MISGDQLTLASIERNEGGLSILKQQPNITLHRFLFANWNQLENRSDHWNRSTAAHERLRQ